MIIFLFIKLMGMDRYIIWGFVTTFTLIHSWYNLYWAQFIWLHIIHDLVFLQAFKTRDETISHSQYNGEIIRHLFLCCHASKRSIKIICQWLSAKQRSAKGWTSLIKDYCTDFWRRIPLTLIASTQFPNPYWWFKTLGSRLFL